MTVIKPCYSTSEMKALLHMRHSEACKKFLLKMHIPVHTAGKGKKDYWLLSDIRDHAPQLFDSIMEAANLNELITKKPALEVDEQFYSQLHLS